MRSSRATTADNVPRPGWRIIGTLLPYLLEFRGRVAVAVVCLVLAKGANVLVPVALKYIVDTLGSSGGDVLLLVPMALVGAYGLLRFSATFFGELRDAVFARVAERAMRRASLAVFRHLHQLQLSFHLGRQTGGLARDIERGTNGMSFLLRFMLFNIVPTVLEIVMVAGILLFAFSPGFVLTVLVAVVIYIAFSIVVTEWRTRFVREANAMDNRSNTRAVDSLLNYETVKYFNNEAFEAERYDLDLEAWEEARLKNRFSLAVLNSGQALIIAVSIIVMMAMAVYQVRTGAMTMGDLVMVNAYMIQLFMPLNALGFVYREIRQALVDIERMFGLLDEAPAIGDHPDAVELQPNGGAVAFHNVDFAYQPERPILRGVDLTIPAGHKVAVVGPSGAGKSTLARLLFRFYDVTAGAVTVNGQDIRNVTQDSLRAAIGVVPQDTVLFNDTIRYNIAYGRPDAGEEEIRRAVDLADLRDLVARLPDGLETRVGERGLKVSGGEKQRIAIARVLLKDPPILVLDEATSSLDSASEQAILHALNTVARRRTTLAIAHRLSTVMDADRIVVLDQGRVVEHGDHASLVAAGGVYAALWRQQRVLGAVDGEDPA